MTVPAGQETSWIYTADRPALARLQNALEEKWGTRPNRPATHGYAIRAGLMVRQLMEALEFYADESLYTMDDFSERWILHDCGDKAAEALELARKALEGSAAMTIDDSELTEREADGLSFENDYDVRP